MHRHCMRVTHFPVNVRRDFICLFAESPAHLKYLVLNQKKNPIFFAHTQMGKGSF